MGQLIAVLRLAALLVLLGIGVGILFVVLDAKETGIVGSWLDACRFVVDPFDRIVDLERGREHLQIAINWGIAAAIYALALLLLSRLLMRMSGIRR